MNIDYSYLRRRAQFGSPCMFTNEGPSLVDNLYPNKTLTDKYLTKNPVNKGTQEGAVMSIHEVNTWRADFTDRGMFHDQGGWPKDLNILDEEAVLRFRKKLEREDNYIASMRALTKPIEHAILQNNAINIYEKYFEGSLSGYSVSESLSQIRNIYRDPKAVDIARPVSHLSWSPERGTFVASYCNTKFQMMNPNESTGAYIWNVEIPSTPQAIFDSKIPILSLEYNPMDHNVLVGGMYTGQVACFDPRKAPTHVEISSQEVSHRDSCHSVLWINSKSGMEFFSTSFDGVVKWWDCRYLNRVTDSIILDPSKYQNIVNSYGATCLEYDSSIPAKYLVGTLTGHVICGNRKGTSIAEKLPYVLKAHTGPIYSLMRNPAFSKMIMTVGDWNVRIWAEECKESAVMWTKNYKVNVTCGEWSKGRPCVFCTTRSDGYLDLWDVLVDQRNPLVSVRVTDRGLTTLRMEEQGQLVVVGDEAGKCHLIHYGESLAVCAKNDKAILSAMFDRESHREKILEGRMKEIRLVLKLKQQLAEEAQAAKEAAAMEAAAGPAEGEEEGQQLPEEVLKAEDEYWSEVARSLGAYKDVGKKKEEETEAKVEVKMEEEKAAVPEAAQPQPKPDEPSEPNSAQT